MKIIDMNLKNNPYKVYIEDGILLNSKKYIKEVYHNKKIYIITDTNVSKLYLEELENILKDEFIVKSIIVEAGEKSKSFETYVNVLEQLFKLDIRRNELLIALGGGVIGDLTGFIASSIYRGIPYIGIPTSLLAQMDSSIGGKTGIDFYGRKNVVGAFKQPLAVLIDPKTLDTLDKREFSNGMGELIKHGLIGNKDLFDKLKKHPKIDENIIFESLKVKQKVVLEDEFDQGNRMILNFGHTFGHIIELEEGYKHGEAVAIGMLMAIKFGIDLNITNKDIYKDVVDILNGYNLPTKEYDYKKYLSKTIYDKKNLAGVVSFILIKEVGKTCIYKVDEEKLKELV